MVPGKYLLANRLAVLFIQKEGWLTVFTPSQKDTGKCKSSRFGKKEGDLWFVDQFGSEIYDKQDLFCFSFII